MNKLNKKLIIPLIILLIIATSFTVFASELQVHFIDIGQGDAILIQTPEDKNMLIDGGDRFNWVADRLTGYLEEQNVSTVHAIVGTHPHADHIGGLPAVIENFEVEKVYDSGRVHTTKTYEDYLRLIDRKDILFHTPRRGENIQLGELNFAVLHPGSGVERYSLNNASIVLHLEYGDISFLFTGDVEKEAEKEILASDFDLEATVLKVAHHGSSSSTIPEFLEEVNPEVAVIQLGEDNRYGHPHDEVLERFKSSGVDVYRNDKHGNIVVKTDGDTYTINADIEADIVQAKININIASKAELQELGGVGAAIAERIIEYRENVGSFERIEDIKKVNGIGSGRFEEIKDEITI
ncbi:MBL fold metallo-hydrolase [Fuchsiella alkaliacetigena]|uniref:MBL fold metallo-hydrolase n=1 Tax=Fuchsiella alkaliacetigena TaxID=957042 RepID=UPI00200A40F4|nr:MBL fold metallo-hydrolase [Fuchsiella alkaliacetigena]MCK8826040.1 helix-hairpin-helix domain-containing protein [Fuchsiella alkaliacetigena]